MCEAIFFGAYGNKAKVEKHTLHGGSKVYYFFEFLTEFLLVSQAAPKEQTC